MPGLSRPFSDLACDVDARNPSPIMDWIDSAYWRNKLDGQPKPSSISGCPDIVGHL